MLALLRKTKNMKKVKFGAMILLVMAFFPVLFFIGIAGPRGGEDTKKGKNDQSTIIHQHLQENDVVYSGKFISYAVVL